MSISSLLSTLGGAGSSKIVIEVQNQTTGLKPLDGCVFTAVRMRLNSNTMRHKMEDGTSLVDVRVTLPREVEIDAIITQDGSLDAINQAFMNRQDLYTIRSKGIVLTEFCYSGETFTHGAQNTSAMPVTLKFKEILASNLTQNTTANPADDNTANRGLANIGAAVSQTVSNVYASVNNAVSTGISQITSLV